MYAKNDYIENHEVLLGPSPRSNAEALILRYYRDEKTKARITLVITRTKNGGNGQFCDPKYE